MEARKERKAGQALPPLDLAASSSWPPLDTSAGPQLDLSADLIPVDLNADLIPVDLNAETPVGRSKKRRTGKPSTGQE